MNERFDPNKQARREAYLKKLRDPRWQKIRLEVFQRDEFSCQHCATTTETLHVHHLYYEKGKEPWEYELDALMTLCEECHEAESAERGPKEQTLLSTLKRMGWSHEQVLDLAAAFNRHGRVHDFSAGLLEFVIGDASPELWEIIEKHWSIHVKEKARLRKERGEA